MPESKIDRETLSHIAKLARLRLEPEEEEKLLRDLDQILNYFEELKELDTEGVKPVNGGTYLKDVFRADGYPLGSEQGKGESAFPKSDKGFLKVPPVFKSNRK